MKRALVVVLLVGALAVAASATVVDSLTALIDEDCISGAEVTTVFSQVFSGFDLSAITGCVTTGDLANALVDALGLRGTLLESLFGLSDAEKLAIAQREGVMVIGDSDESLTGLDLAAIVAGVSYYLGHHIPWAEGILLDDMAAVTGLFESARDLLPPGVLNQLIPVLEGGPAYPSS